MYRGMEAAVALMLTVLCTSCVGSIPLDQQDHYTKADVDAINAVIQCKAAARTVVQIMRCENNRR